MRDDFCHWPDLGLLALRSKVHLPDAHEPEGRRERKSKNRAEKREKRVMNVPVFILVPSLTASPSSFQIILDNSALE
jgi:hypothetical protein